MVVSLPESVVELLSADGMSAERAVTVNLAGHLYSRGKLSVGAAAEVAGMTRWEFEKWLRDEGIEMPWTQADLEQELAFVAGD
jgi:predicted HTH domain antitoxin